VSGPKKASGSSRSRTAIDGFGVEFRPFLQAQLWEEKNGMRLSILSALARLDLDPWQEAAVLAALPKETASLRLSELLRRLPGAPASAINGDPSWAGALGLLPAASPPAPTASVAIVARSIRPKWLLIVELAFFASMLASFVIMIAQEPLSRGDSARPAAPAALSVHTSAPSHR
jgi:hypothetical protein